MVLFLLLVSCLVLPNLFGSPKCCEAATVALKREAVGSGFFNDSSSDQEWHCDYDGEILLSHPMSIGKDDRYYILGR
jgi:hypothetical protein